MLLWWSPLPLPPPSPSPPPESSSCLRPQRFESTMSITVSLSESCTRAIARHFGVFCFVFGCCCVLPLPLPLLLLPSLLLLRCSSRSFNLLDTSAINDRQKTVRPNGVKWSGVDEQVSDSLTEELVCGVSAVRGLPTAT